MAMRVQYGTPAVCMVMAPPERRECVPMPSGVNQSLAALTQRVSSLRKEMIFEALTERIP